MGFLILIVFLEDHLEMLPRFHALVSYLQAQVFHLYAFSGC